MAAFAIENLPAVNASLNAAAGLFMLAGIVAIKRKNEALHKKLMLSAVAFSAAFLVCYLLYHGLAESKKFQAEGFWRTAYFVMLITHVFLAVLVVPLVLLSVRYGLAASRGDNAARQKHRRIVRWTFPIWLYVSITGVLVYFSVHVWQ